MCFLLYVGTTEPIPRKEWVKEAPGISVRNLNEYDAEIKTHFGSPEVQYIGSTSGCGCDFPSVMHQNGGWPIYENSEEDEEYKATIHNNRQGLVELLRMTSEETIEIYGVWAGDFAKEPFIREEISLDIILGPDFYFKERGFYIVHL
jgi:hypothetical protein